MKKIFFIAFVLTPLLIHSQGLIRSSKASELVRENPRVQKTRSLNIPSNYSLEKYTPHVFNQGQSKMCTAYSLALARTIVYARNNKLTNKNLISAEAYSPYYIYSKYKNSAAEDFEGGLTMYFNKLNEFGYAKMKEVEYPHYYPFTETQLWDYSVPSYINLDLEYIKSEKFDQINSIYVDDVTTEEGRKELTDLIKSEIVSERPVIFGMNIFKSFNESEDYWDPGEEVYCDELILVENEQDYCHASNTNPSGKCDEHKPEEYYEGHSMTLIAFDDEKYGGSFLIQNSWGQEAHNNGKVWIPYVTFAYLAVDIQSLDKAPKTIFDEPFEYSFNYSTNEINPKTRDFSKDLDINWFLFTMLTIENHNKKDAQKNKLILPNKLKISGQLEDNLLEGYGEINLNNKFKYNGIFSGGYFDGNGELKKYDNWGDLISKRVGIFSKGKFMDGDVDEDIKQRRLRNMDGYKIIGKMKNGVYYGFGRLEHNQWDDTFEGYFENNYPVNGYEKVTGTYEYEGEFFNFLPHGKGKRVWSDGEIEEGKFEYGSFIE